MTYDHNTKRTYLSDDGRRLITVEEWIDRQVSPPRYRSKNRHRKLKPNEIAYYEQHPEAAERAKSRS
jgi:hypothetical protein